MCSVLQARCPRWCPYSRALWTACRLCRSVWPKLSVKNSTDSWITAWTRKLWHHWVPKPDKPAPMPKTPCCTIGPCRSASASVDHVKRLSVSECIGPCAFHRVRNLCMCVCVITGTCMFKSVWEYKYAWMLHWACSWVEMLCWGISRAGIIWCDMIWQYDMLFLTPRLYICSYPRVISLYPCSPSPLNSLTLYSSIITHNHFFTLAIQSKTEHRSYEKSVMWKLSCGPGRVVRYWTLLETTCRRWYKFCCIETATQLLLG